jgi:hypothetical protein
MTGKSVFRLHTNASTLMCSKKSPSRCFNNARRAEVENSSFYLFFFICFSQQMMSHMSTQPQVSSSAFAACLRLAPLILCRQQHYLDLAVWVFCFGIADKGLHPRRAWLQLYLMALPRLDPFAGPVNELVLAIASIQGVLPWPADKDIVSVSSKELVIPSVAEEPIVP